MFAPLPDKAATMIYDSLDEHGSLAKHLGYHDKFTQKLPIWIVTVNAGCRTDEETVGELAKSVESLLNKPDRRVSGLQTSTVNKGGHFPNLFPGYTSLCDTEKLATLAHFPVTPIPQFRSLERTSMKNVAPLEAYTAGETRIGTGQAQYNSKQILPVSLPESVRDRHLYVVGKSGTGKSTLMETVARHDI